MYILPSLVNSKTIQGIKEEGGNPASGRVGNLGWWESERSDFNHLNVF